MAVDTNLASLYEKLKIEDPCGPPRPWESIPSESGLSHCHSSSAFPSSSSRRRLFDISTVSEASLVRLALNSLHGLESALISIDQLSAAFCSDPADRAFHRITSLWDRSSSTHALGKILKSIGFCGYLVFLLRKFVEYFSSLNLDVMLNGTAPVNTGALVSQDRIPGQIGDKELLPFGLVNQAFAGAVGKILDGYICALDTLCTSVGLRRSLKVTSSSLHEYLDLGCLSSVVHSKVTLLEVYLHTREMRTQIEALGSLCNLHSMSLCFSHMCMKDLTAKATAEFPSFPRGGDLLTYLYKELQAADPAHCALLKFLLVRSCEPYFGFIRSWIYKAEINDPYEEFIVGHAQESVLHPNGKPGHIPRASFQVRDEAAIPCFLKEFLVPLVRAGQQLQVLMKLFELCSFVSPGINIYDDFLPCWKDFLNASSTSLLTFNKTKIEALVLARTKYYSMMQEKLEKVSTKFEFRYQEVASFDSEKYRRNLDPVTSLISNGSLVAPPTAGQEGVGDMDSDNSSTTCAIDAFESSDCSSNYSEEEIEPREQIEIPNDLYHHEQNYLSALKFTYNSCKDSLVQQNQVYNESDSHDAFKRGVPGIVGSSYPNGMTSNHQSVSRELNHSFVSSNQRRYAVDESDHLDVPLCTGSCLPPLDLDLVSSWSKVEVSEETSSAREMVAALPFVPGALCKDELVSTSISSNLYELQSLDLRDKWHFLSMNPMLSLNSFTRLTRKCGPNSCNAYGKSLPCFEFSSVEDAVEVYVEKLAANTARKDDYGPSVMANPNALGVSGYHHEKTPGSRNVLIGNTEAPFAHSDLNVNDQNQEDSISVKVTGGSRWESLLGSFKETVNESVRQAVEISFDIFEMPVEFVVEKCLLQEIWLQYKYVSKLTIKLFEDGFDLQEHLLTLRRYHFMGVADWADLFIMSLWHHKWFVTEAVQRVSDIQGLLETSIQRSSCECDNYKDRLFVYVKEHDMMPLSTSAIGIHSFDFLGFGYRVEWPISIILTPTALKIYAEIFNFLIKVKLAVFSLTDVWCLFKDSMHPSNQNIKSQLRESKVNHVKVLMKMRHQLNHFVSMLQQYVQSQLSHVSWCRLLHSLKHKVKDMMDLEYVHMEYLSDSLHICFLSEETQAIGNIIKNVLQYALDFRFCLTRPVQGYRDQADSSDKLSAIDISMVQSIKKKFDKNMEELHLLYLRSPKHGKFGLSQFWSLLNYNECYSEYGNQKGFLW